MKEAFEAVKDVKLVKYTDLLKPLMLNFFSATCWMSCMELLRLSVLNIKITAKLLQLNFINMLGFIFFVTPSLHTHARIQNAN